MHEPCGRWFIFLPEVERVVSQVLTTAVTVFSSWQNQPKICQARTLLMLFKPESLESRPTIIVFDSHSLAGVI